MAVAHSCYARGATLLPGATLLALGWGGFAAALIQVRL